MTPTEVSEEDYKLIIAIILEITIASLFGADSLTVNEAERQLLNRSIQLATTSTSIINQRLLDKEAIH